VGNGVRENEAAGGICAQFPVAGSAVSAGIERCRRHGIAGDSAGKVGENRRREGASTRRASASSATSTGRSTPAAGDAQCEKGG